MAQLCFHSASPGIELKFHVEMVQYLVLSAMKLTGLFVASAVDNGKKQ